jgi:hypothetical protein
VSVVEWTNLKDMTSVMLSEEETSEIEGAAGYKVAITELCNWGDALTRLDTIRIERMVGYKVAIPKLCNWGMLL